MAEALPAWAKGINLKRLEAYASVFEKTQKHLVFGAFGLLKERDIATALDEKKLRAGPGAVAIVSTLKTSSVHHFFSGRSAFIGRGSTYISDFACLDVGYGVELLEGIIKEFNPPNPIQGNFLLVKNQVYIEIFEEDEIAKKVLTNFDFMYFGTKVSAGSELKGLYMHKRFAPDIYDPIEEQATLLTVDGHFIDADDIAVVLEELESAKSLWEQHYSNYNKRKSWTSFCLRGFSTDPTFIIKPAEMSRKWKEENPEKLKWEPVNTSISESFPHTWRIVNRIPGGKDRVRFMCLRKEDGELSRHADITDRDAGVSNGKVARFHIPIVTAPGVKFMAWDARGNKITKTFKAGSLFYLDQRKPHSVLNESGIDRIHLVIDTYSYSEVRKLIASGVK